VNLEIADFKLKKEEAKEEEEKEKKKKQKKQKKKHTGETPVRRMGKMPMPRTTGKEKTRRK